MDKPDNKLADGVQLFADALIFGGPEAHERQAARRAESFAENETLPTKMSLASTNWIPPDKEEENERLARETLAKWGVKFLGSVEGGQSLQRVELPTGWKKIPTYEPRLVMLVDDKGRERARICLFSENKVLVIQPRYGVREMLLNELFHGNGPISAVVADGRIVTGEGGALYETEPTDLPLYGQNERYKARRKAVEDAEAWLDEHYPDWRNPLAYWD